MHPNTHPQASLSAHTCSSGPQPVGPGPTDPISPLSWTGKGKFPLCLPALPNLEHPGQALGWHLGKRGMALSLPPPESHPPSTHTCERPTHPPSPVEWHFLLPMMDRTCTLRPDSQRVQTAPRAISSVPSSAALPTHRGAPTG